LVTLEALLSYRIRTAETVLSRGWILQYLTEFFILLLGIKIYLILLHAGGAGWGNPAYWRSVLQADPLDSETFFSILYTIVIWILACRFAEYFHKMEEDPELMVQQKLGLVNSDSDETRRQLISLIFGVGAAMLLVTAMVRLDLSGIGLYLHSTPSRVWPLILYFVFGFAILAQTRYSTLRIRWYLENIPPGDHLAVRWVVYSIFLFFIVGFVSLLLPTSYSLGLLETLRGILSVIFALFTLIFGLVTSPLLLLFQWLSNLVPQADTGPVTQPTLPPIPTPAPALIPPVAIADWVRSALYWFVLLVVIAFSMVYYLRSRSGYAQVLGQFHLSRWWNQLWHWVSRRYKRINQTIVDSVQAGFNRLRQSKPSDGFRRRLLEKAGPLPPRNRVRQIYLGMLRQAAENGIPRKTSQTPYEYARNLHETLPEVTSEVDKLTDGFMEARYSPHEITEQQAGLLQQLWDRVCSAIHHQPPKKPLL
jgi:hypothetical protein